MQSYEYGPLDVGPAIGFQVPTTHRRIRPPPRKVTALEALPPLNTEVAAEITRRVKVREQAQFLAAIREAKEKESERQRRANRAMPMRIPPCLALVPTTYSAEDLEAALLSAPELTPLTRPKCKQLQTQPSQLLGLPGNHSEVHKQIQVRWAAELTS